AMKNQNLKINNKEVELTASCFEVMEFEESKDIGFDVKLNGEYATGMLWQKDDNGERTFFYAGNPCVEELRDELENLVGEVEGEDFDKIIEVLESWAKEYAQKSKADEDPLEDSEFLFTVGNVAINGVSVKVYKKDENSYFVRVEDKDGKIVRGTRIAEISTSDYENLPNDPYDNLIKRKAVLELCEI
ncbi:hypothetical protein ROV67_00005, partial [Pasteurella multocida]|uniref:hypothetical protein n=1 Tax=Pasteurella multocida TaxID=747 RepID=UPI002C72379C